MCETAPSSVPLVLEKIKIIVHKEEGLHTPSRDAKLWGKLAGMKWLRGAPARNQRLQKDESYWKNWKRNLKIMLKCTHVIIFRCYLVNAPVLRFRATVWCFVSFSDFLIESALPATPPNWCYWTVPFVNSPPKLSLYSHIKFLERWHSFLLHSFVFSYVWQVFSSYGCQYVAESWDERQDYLRNEYYFECDCKPCVEDWPRYDYLPRIDMKLTSGK